LFVEVDLADQKDDLPGLLEDPVFVGNGGELGYACLK